MRSILLTYLALVSCSVFSVGCDTPLSVLVALDCALRGESEPPPQIEFEQDPDDPCLRTTTANLDVMPNYQKELADARCQAFDNIFCRHRASAVQTGLCEGGTILYVQNSSGLTARTTYHDAHTGQYVAHSTFTDGAVLCFTTYFVRRIDCDDRVVLENLCP